MFRNYLRTAVRNQLRKKSYFFINLVGLALGISCSFTIFLWVRAEFSMDDFHKKGNRIALVRSSLRESDETIVTFEDSQGLVANAALEQIPEVAAACRVIKRQDVLFSRDDKVISLSGIAADTSFFHMFSFPIAEGDDRHPLENADAIAISRSMAKRFFGDRQAIGQLLKLDNHFDVMVSAVFEDVPEESSIQFDFAIPMEHYITSNNVTMSWNSYSFLTYVALRDPTDFESTSRKFEELAKNNNPDDDGAEWLFLQSFKDVYLHSRFVDGKSVGGRIEYIQLFSIAGLFMIIIACVNFVNLATARAGRRSKEVGIRKVNGAVRRQLIAQFLGESFTLTFFSVALSMIVLEVALPLVNLSLGTHLRIDFANPETTVVLAGLLIIISLASGLYPAFVLSTFHPAQTLRSTSVYSGGKSLRKVLVTVQFVLSVLLLISTAAIYQQVRFIRNKNMGFNREQVLYFRPHGTLNHIDELRHDLMNDPSIISVGTSSRIPLSVNSASTSLSWPGMRPDAVVQFRAIDADYDFMQTIELPIVAGRGFSRDFPAQDTVHQFIITEEGARRMQLENPIGTRITFRRKKGEIVGVAGDFHSRSIHSAIDPVIFTLVPKSGLVFVKIDAHASQQAISTIESAYRKLESVFPFEYHFLDETFARQYRSEEFAERLAFGFSCISLFVAILGLYGLALFSVERRIKEIGIRKVLGAPLFHLVRLLSQEIISLVLLANLLAWPISWVVVMNWLGRFAYRTNIGITLFASAMIITLATAVLVVGAQTLRAALDNPVKTLKQD